MIDTTAAITRRSRVLVADDTESVRALFRKLSAAEGHDVIAVQDGAEALEAVHEHHPDVILLDVSMPQVDGLEVCRRLKADPATRLTPVVLVTGTVGPVRPHQGDRSRRRRVPVEARSPARAARARRHRSRG